MPVHVAYLPEGESPYPLDCWLRSLSAEGRVVLLLGGGSEIPAGRWHSAVSAVYRVEPDAPLSAAVRQSIASSTRVHISLSLEHVPMRYRAGASMPEVAPHYDLLRQLWHWGFREAVFVGHGGETVLPMPHLLDALCNRHRGERCFVVGNGPSLNDIDMKRLKGQITLGSNRCYLGYETWGFPFTYWGVYDQFQIEEYHLDYEAHVPAETVKFFPAEFWPVLRVAAGCPVNSVWPDPSPRSFSDDPARVYRGFTVTYMLLQIAAIMGCDPIILIGADHRYELSRRGYSRLLRSIRRGVARHARGGRVYEAALAAHRVWKKGGVGGAPALWTTADAASPTHFTTRYTDGGRNRFLPPEPEEAERDFACAQRWAETSGRRIINATPNSALEVFPQVEFSTLF
jgi:hypothetical protein